MSSRNDKIKTLEDLAVILHDLKSQGKIIVHSHGVFDLLHLGHVRHFEQAKALGDILIVTITQDQFVNKGPHRPAFPQDMRAEMLASLEMIDFVAINRTPLAVEAIKLLKPDIYVKGSEYRQAADDITGGIMPETEAIHSVGGEIQFTEDIVFSSSSLINHYMSAFSPEVDEYLKGFRKQHSSDEVLSWIDQARKLRPLVIGEAIIDDYLFTDILGKSSKDPVLATLYKHMDSFIGGSLAVANHLAHFCEEVYLLTQLGDDPRDEDFIAKALMPNIRPTFLTKKNTPTIHKQRILEDYSETKMLEIYRMNDRVSTPEETNSLCAEMGKIFEKAGLTIVADYGHGMFNPQSISYCCNGAPFLTVNAQSNAGNRGYNPISKYPRADYICLAGHEITLDARTRDPDLRTAVLGLSQRIDCPNITITQGKRGTLHYDPANGFYEAPALATQVRDRVGAGDAVLAVTSLLKKVGAPWDIVGFVGNVAGAELVGELGNRRSLEHITFSKHVISLLK